MYFEPQEQELADLNHLVYRIQSYFEAGEQDFEANCCLNSFLLNLQSLLDLELQVDEIDLKKIQNPLDPFHHQKAAEEAVEVVELEDLKVPIRIQVNLHRNLLGQTEEAELGLIQYRDPSYQMDHQKLLVVRKQDLDQVRKKSHPLDQEMMKLVRLLLELAQDYLVRFQKYHHHP